MPSFKIKYLRYQKEFYGESSLYLKGFKFYIMCTSEYMSRRAKCLPLSRDAMEVSFLLFCDVHPIEHDYHKGHNLTWTYFSC